MAFIKNLLADIPAEQVRSQRDFAAKVVAPPGATASKPFVAWTGRDPRLGPMP